MLHAVDHLVIAVPDLAAAVASYRDLGFTVVAGGRHPGAGTDNALIVFRDTSYLELLGFHEPRRDHRWWTPLSRGGGLVDFCLQTDDLAGDAKTLRQAGVEMSELGRGDRRRPDGVEVRWIWALARGAHRGVAPFLLAEDGPRDERVPRERAHANGVTGIGVVTVAVDDLPSVRRWYAAALGSTGQDLAFPELGAVGARFAVGPHAFEFLAPTGAGPVRDWITARGASPYSATLVGGHRAGPLDLGRTQGARLALA
ncbi:MAG TPA: VOC family protein [Methylomirabilota bacterium]|jgi:catechol 2,3-dioxygenase-like lactoylglutathione lyase family enzyme